MDALLAHIRRYIPLPQEMESEVLRHFKPFHARKKAILLREGAPCRHRYFVVSGCLRLCYGRADGTEHTTEFALEGWWLTDIGAYAKGDAARFSIIAVEDSELLALDRAAEATLLAAVPQLHDYFRRIYERAAAAAQWRQRIYDEHSREELFFNFCKLYPDFVQRVPQYLLASFLGITPEYLSTLRRRAFLKRD